MKTIQYNTLDRILQRLSAEDAFVFLDTSRPAGDNTTSFLFLHPVERLRYREGEEEKSFLEKVQDVQRRGYYVAGWISYEFGCLLEPALRKQVCRREDRGALLADMGVFEAPRIFDHATGETDFPLDDIPLPPLAYGVENVIPSQKKEDYLRAVDRVLEYIRAGDTYQVNYTLKLHFDFHGSPESFYRDLRRNQSVSYGAYIRWGGKRVLSFSPELFFRKKGGVITVRPMKGTWQRGRTPEEDEGNRKFLANDAKNRSENVMIVDLLRNDLGRLMHCLKDGDVRVNSLFDIETYETLLQMTSTIEGVAGKDVLNDVSLHAFLKAVFPCGSVTGAPKIRTMQIIDELEKTRRGVYTGAIGYFSPAGEAVFNVPIRTVVLDGKSGEMGIGSGIVHGSEPKNEWRECLLKGRFLTRPRKEFQLIETLLWHPESGYWLLEDHLKRLRKSAAFFLFNCPCEDIETRLRESGAKFDSHICMRVRLLLRKDGSCEIFAAACENPHHSWLPDEPEKAPSNLPKIAMSSETVEKNSVWIRHKTTRRELYDREYKRAGENGLFDIFFRNDKNEITEGCISNIIAYRDGEFSTPPLSSGLLGGVMRGHLMRSREKSVVARVLKLEDIRRAEALYCCNSLRGVVRVEIAEKE